MRKLPGLCMAAMMLAAPAFAQGYTPPRTSDGKPDLQGVWTNASLTSLERPASFQGQTLPADRAAQMEQQRARMMRAQNAPTDPKQGAPTDGNANAGYNSFWIDPGTTFGKVKGEYRTSWIVDPPDGKIPYTAAGRKTFDEKITRVRTTWDGPEARPQGERCIVGFGSTGGPPMINVLYNNHYQIVQTPKHVVITVEMNHDARVVPIAASKAEAQKMHAPDSFQKWLGDSVGWWEGDVLVVETINFHPDIRMRPNMGASFYVGEDSTVTERFSRAADDALLYEFTVEDPVAFSRPWRAEMAMTKATDKMYEYACHEGNYAMPGILAGAREDERRGKKTGEVGDAE